MPRCQDRWTRGKPAQVKVTVTKPAHGDRYSLSSVTGRTTGIGPLEVRSFDSQKLANGSATWQVPHGHASIFTLATDGTGALQTAIEIDGQPVTCTSAQHCQGACQAEGIAGLAGYWRVTVRKAQGPQGVTP